MSKSPGAPMASRREAHVISECTGFWYKIIRAYHIAEGNLFICGEVKIFLWNCRLANQFKLSLSI